MHALVGQAPAEMVFRHIIGGAQDKVHDLHRGVHNAQFVSVALERL